MFSFVYKNIDFAHKYDAPSKPTELHINHLHYFHEIIYFVKGDASYTVETETRRLKPGDIIIIPSGKYHFATVNDKTEYERYVLKFPAASIPDHINAQILQRGNGSYFLNGGRYKLNFEQLDRYFESYEKDDLCALFTCELVKLLVMLCKQPTLSEKKLNDNVTQIINFIDENLEQPLTLDLIAEKLNFSRSHISNEFRKNMQISIMQYIRLKKVIAAHQLILSGEKKSVAAEKFGFENYSTFYRAYTKIVNDSANKTKNSQ